MNLANNHGVAGALNLLCLLQELIAYWPDIDSRLILVFELAAEAIFLHDLAKGDRFMFPTSEREPVGPVDPSWPSVQKPLINFADSPLAVILILADEIQDWRRPQAEHRHSRAKDEVIVKWKAKHAEVRYRWDQSQRESSRRRLKLSRHVCDNLVKAHNPWAPDKIFSYDGFIEISCL